MTMDQIVGRSTIPATEAKEMAESVTDELHNESAPIHDLSIAELRSRYEARSSSMPTLKPICQNASPTSKILELPNNTKARHGLQLPSFKSLGIAVPRPDHLLTPPEEPDLLAWHPLSQPLPTRADIDIPRSVPDPAVRLTPEDEQTMTVPLDSEAIDSEAMDLETSTRSTTQPFEVTEEDPAMRPSSSSSEGDSPGGPVWLEHAIDAVGKSFLGLEQF